MLHVAGSNDSGPDEQAKVHLVAGNYFTVLVLIAVGLAAGLPLALGTTRWLKSFLFGVSEMDPLAMSAALLLMLALALLAGYLPARRAARVESHAGVAA